MFEHLVDKSIIVNKNDGFFFFGILRKIENNFIYVEFFEPGRSGELGIYLNLSEVADIREGRKR